MTDAQQHEADRATGAPHPRRTVRLYGQSAAEATFLDAFNSGRLHHGWLLTGPRGVGKATLAWRIARFLLTRSDAGGDQPGGPDPVGSLDADPAAAVCRRLAQLAEPRAFLLRPVWDDERKRFKQGITIDEVRRLKNFFHMSAADAGSRVVIVDAADEMNTSAANALLKLLEEPPEGAVLLLVSHQPARLLPTIRSRCRALRLATLNPEDMAAALAGSGIGATERPEALAALAGGSVGQAIRMITMNGLGHYGQLVALMQGAPHIDRPAAIALADAAAVRGDVDQFAFMADLLDIFLSRLARTGIAGPPEGQAAPGEAVLFVRLAPDAGAARHWARLQQSLGARARQGHAVNLDPAALFLDTLLKINDAARDMAA